MEEIVERSHGEVLLVIFVIIVLVALLSMIATWLGGRSDSVWDSAVTSAFDHLPFPLDFVLLVLVMIGFFCWQCLPSSAVKKQKGWRKQLMDQYRIAGTIRRQRKRDKKQRKRSR